MSKTHNRPLIIFILGALSTISPFAIDMYLPAFPEMAAGLDTTTARISLSLSSYFAGFAAAQLIYGPLLDRFGRKPPLYAGMGLFVMASVACMLARNVEWLIAWRFVQALGGCAAAVAAMAMVRDFFPVRDTAKIISLLILVLSASPFLAPSIGMFVTMNLGWRWVFVVLSAFVLVMLAVSAFVLPVGYEPDRNIKLRPLPILRNYAEVLKEPQFLTYALATGFAFSGLLVYVASAPIVFMEVFHVSTKQFSAIFAGLAVGFIGSNQVNILLLRKCSSEQIFPPGDVCGLSSGNVAAGGNNFWLVRPVGDTGAAVRHAVGAGPVRTERLGAGAGAIRPQHRQRFGDARLPATRRGRTGLRVHWCF